MRVVCLCSQVYVRVVDIQEMICLVVPVVNDTVRLLSRGGMLWTGLADGDLRLP